NAPPPPDYLARPNPELGIVRQIQSEGRETTNALELSFRGSVNRYFSGQAQYTLGFTHNNTGGIEYFPPNTYDLTGEWARADYDQRHQFQLLGTLGPFRGFNLGVIAWLSSGIPYTVTTGRDDFNDGRANARPFGIPRNSMQGAGYTTIDLRLSKEFRF